MSSEQGRQEYQSGQSGLLSGDGSQPQGGLFQTPGQQQTHQPPAFQGEFAPPPQQPQAVSQQQPQFNPPPTQAELPSQQQQHFPPPPSGPPPQTSPSQPYFPPPPPGGPPPATQESGVHPDPLHANPVKPNDPLSSEKPADPAAQNYTIPAYVPAHPQFAPAPTEHAPPAQDSTAPATEVPYTTAPQTTAPYSTAPYTTAPATETIPTDEQAHGKHSWSSRLSKLGQKAAGPINSLVHKLGSQSFLPEPLDKECDKAATILRAFCTKGVYADATQAPTSTNPEAKPTTDAIIDPTKEKPKSKVIVTIPPKVIAKAAGLAIFTTLRAGFNISGATGSGILIARLPDGSWGAPSAISVHSVGAGFAIGMDIYDCVCVINTPQALEAFTKTRVSLGSDVTIAAGPIGAGGAVQFGAAVQGRDSRKKDEKEATAAVPTEQTLKPEDDKKSHRRSLSASAFKPVFSYVKSRGFFAGISIDGTVIIEREEANAAFFGTPVPVEKIIKGQVPAQGPNGMWPSGARLLHDTLKGAEVGSLVVKDDGKPAVIDPTPVASGAGTGQHPAPAPAPGNAPPPSFAPPLASGTTGVGSDLPPGYVDDGIARPGVGDVKYQ